ncbi:hypothetical protein SAMN05428988_5601 [Chitinophaga sp. YR573]|uniref:fimbrial biogenesis chaperone n=1 Tax=Chitinophaga sp. YR573 TaxID=1881040 RepID=UPI0008BE8479|nr:hypothetical protein [Chitinophaga sp. YR573]SEW43660.1 hypothetical protein SAMN05428988_5601 [Chitinophaga sp. YR573]
MKSTLLNLTIIIAGFLPIKTIAQGNLLITPVRVVFEGQKKMQELNLANTGKDSAKYLISFVEMRMNEDGTFDKINVPDSGQHFASGNLRYFPRTVILAPGEAQLIKIQTTKTNQLTAGEYRSHIYFRAVPNEKPLGEQIPATDSTGISVKLIPVFGITIPVIIRIGASTTKVTISGLSMNDSIPYQLDMSFYRTGNFSVYGDLTVNYVSPQGKITKAGIVNGMALYTPNTIRHFQMKLDDKAGINLHKGRLQVIYTAKTDNAAVSELGQAWLELK